jgi:hypothetical protein
VSQQVNLYQPIFRREEKKFSARAMAQGTGLVVAGVALMVGYTLWQVSGLRAQLKQAEAQQAAVSKRLDDVVRQFGGGMRPRTAEEEIARLEGEAQAKERIYGILQSGVFSNRDGFSDYFAALARQHTAGLRLTHIYIRGAADELWLQGKVTDREALPRYVQRLGREKKLNGVTFHSGTLAQGERATGESDFDLKTAGAKP